MRYSDQLKATALMAFLDDALEVPPAEAEITTELRFLEASDLDKIDSDENIWLVAFFADPKGILQSTRHLSFTESGSLLNQGRVVWTVLRNLTRQSSDSEK